MSTLQSYLLGFLSLLIVDCVTSQDTTIFNNLLRTEMVIPQSAAFDLLGVNPSNVVNPIVVRDFKVDWAFQSWRLSPNIAMQFQPVWEMLYNKADLQKYRRAGSFMRTLSTLDISAGTVEDVDGQRKLSAAMKVNVFREIDPLMEKSIYGSLEKEYKELSKDISQEIYKTKSSLKYLKNKRNKDSLNIALDSLKFELAQLNDQYKTSISLSVTEFLKGNWNASNLEFALGTLLSYQGSGFQNLILSGEGLSAWINGGFGIGDKSLITGLIRYSHLKSKELGRTCNIFISGFNYRFGGYKYNHFSEIIYTYSSDSTLLRNPESPLILNPIGITSGGAWRLNKDIVLNFSIKAFFNHRFTLLSILPSAGISCLMSFK